ncbi:MAG: tRNA (adenosine(37)-N6)-threonylcarbamoyltransferase complex ATPase subunit type 1 TsaE [Tenericutes bacterium HGW-Tenericutes-6]|nr:MAG: tRNA (adenosine(37)-N6)-threonylcarbamoyltransferase complex ATPase subunit type 1 TsaE [Tenericutes bacterium HGW-Tenericutes-7]PKK93202.1 MAG: tRNA (adenosine(37)-N6)-threonylcarbamoyltransferase complex ATPase subunit type 1 TsaE [Tenericutes bacterium HGW-Tenericutes-6]
MKQKVTHSALETESLGYELGLLLKDEPKVVILLDGDLGSGKTTFTKGLARALGITDVVNSPTYTILKKYTTKDLHHKSLYHFDLYRLSEVGDDFDLEEYIDGQGMIVIEWPFHVEELLPKDYLMVTIKKTSETERTFEMVCVGYPCKRAVQYI